MTENVAILGASDREDRYAYKAFKMLQDYGHSVFPVNPQISIIEGQVCVANLRDLKVPVQTLTLYVNTRISSSLKDEMIFLNPKRVIFNPGTENPDLEQALHKAGIETVIACTLVMLRTNQFE